MKLKLIITFVAGFALGLLIIRLSTPKLFSSQPDKLHLLETNIEEVTELFIGPSYILGGIIPRDFDRNLKSAGFSSLSLNLGIPAISPPELHGILSFIEQNQTPKLRTIFIHSFQKFFSEERASSLRCYSSLNLENFRATLPMAVHRSYEEKPDILLDHVRCAAVNLFGVGRLNSLISAGRTIKEERFQKRIKQMIENQGFKPTESSVRRKAFLKNLEDAEFVNHMIQFGRRPPKNKKDVPRKKSHRAPGKKKKSSKKAANRRSGLQGSDVATAAFFTKWIQHLEKKGLSVFIIATPPKCTQPAFVRKDPFLSRKILGDEKLPCKGKFNQSREELAELLHDPTHLSIAGATQFTAALSKAYISILQERSPE